MIGNLRAAGLTGRDVEQSIVVRSMDATELTPERVAQLLPDLPQERGVFAFNPPYGQRLKPEAGEITALYRDVGRTLRRFGGWRRR